MFSGNVIVPPTGVLTKSVIIGSVELSIFRIYEIGCQPPKGHLQPSGLNMLERQLANAEALVPTVYITT